mmetsp:Transcript_58788/g.70109  ORF Transcript_58788/g.70109 Transcript_58788/m.70109 type:complete len:127 (+) Transcript_58788:134-514(+)|eukprot:CAMPEP_0172500892 /NCGR_PEP_ID=MMETSP1066-20121228/143971_1 /TAXON_ID=671091 /ORGANISM="Coscinodiscus wailesii, Strain CCMP2513" /LENGTH=126 /DNA_ID=CAMNT_0013275375 /DNA_START=116 /DNA_END=496 /DNA_ORIENTATION=+
MASQQINQVEEMVKELKKNRGFKAYLILNNDGIVIKWEQIGTAMSYQEAVQHSHLILDLCAKSKAHIKNLFDPPDNNVENIRLRTDQYETIVAQEGNFTLVVIQEDERKAGLNNSSEDSSGETAEA